jgi:hypothetical protein
MFLILEFFFNLLTGDNAFKVYAQLMPIRTIRVSNVSLTLKD